MAPNPQNPITTVADEDEREFRRWISEILDSDKPLSQTDVDRMVLGGEMAVQPLLDYLKRRDMLIVRRDLLEQVLVSIGEPAAPAPYRALRSSNSELYGSAQRVLQVVDPEAEKAVLRKPILDYQRRFGTATRRIIFYVLISACVGLLSRLVALGPYVGGCIGFATVVAYHLLIWLFSGNRKKSLESFENDVEAPTAAVVNILAKSLQDEDKAVCNIAARLLTDRLPQISTEDEVALELAAVSALLKALNGKNAPLSLAILSALEKVGDERAMPAVERVAAGRGAGRDPLVAAQANKFFLLSAFAPVGFRRSALCFVQPILQAMQSGFYDRPDIRVRIHRRCCVPWNRQTKSSLDPLRAVHQS